MKKVVLLFILSMIFLSSCELFREMRAERHQPFQPHMDKSPRSGKHHH